MSQTQSQSQSPTDTEYRIDLKTFIEWCEQQKEHAFGNPRFLVTPDDRPEREDNEKVAVRFILRDIRGLEKIELLRGKDVDTLVFKHDDSQKRFHAHRCDFTFTDRNIIIKHAKANRELSRVGTSHPKRGAFPV